MATLNNPGVSVTFTDESFYASAGEGTVPLFVIGTHSYKSQPNGSGVAEGTLPENAGKLYAITSQRELLQTFGNPLFYSKNGTSVHAYELNEFGLHGTYQYMGVANAAYVVNSGVDYAQLVPRATSPVGEPIHGTYWLDTKNTNWGVFEANGSQNPVSGWTSEQVIVVDDDSMMEEILVGSVGVDSASSTITSSSGSLIINDSTISIAGTSSLNSVITAINGGGASNVTASAIRLGGKSYLKLSSINNAGLKIGSASTAGVLSSLGLVTSAPTFFAPKSTLGLTGDFAVITSFNDNVLYQKLKTESLDGTVDAAATEAWFRVGRSSWKAATPTRAIGKTSATPISTSDVLTLSTNGTTLTTVNMTGVANFADVVVSINAAIDALAPGHANKSLRAHKPADDLIISNATGQDIIISGTGTILEALGLTEQMHVKGNRVYFEPHYNVPSSLIAGDVWIKTTTPNRGADWTVKVYDAATGTWNIVRAPLCPNDASADTLMGPAKTVGSVYVQTNINYFEHPNGNTFLPLTAVSGLSGDPIASHTLRIWTGMSWEMLVYESSEVAPSTDPEAKTMWFNSNARVDIMVNNSGRWVGYATKYPNTDPNGVILSASTPSKQTNGDALVDHDLWINTADTENYPALYRYANNTWVKVSLNNDTQNNGIVFADARWSTNGELDGPQDVAAMLTSPFVDPDAPDARFYPDGVLLFNTRYSTNNVKQWEPFYFAGQEGSYNGTNYELLGYNVGAAVMQPLKSVGRWVTISGSNTDGVAYFGRKAQRQIIVRAMSAVLSNNTDIRAENVYFNLIAAPGYPELIDEMVSLNTDKKQIAFVVGDTPARLDSSSTSLINWAQGLNDGVVGNGEDGLVTADPYVGVYYPWGMSQNIDGQDVMIPPSTMALRTIAYNDNVAYPWMAPAGFTRGLVTNATTVGYLDKSDNFRSVMLNDGQRAVLQQNNINPIAYMPNRGLTIFGQKTRSNVSSAMDRINVARLTNYLRYHLDNLAKPFLFENNNQHTRDSAQIAFSRFMGDLVGLHALYDFLVVCDESNNTPERIDRNELWIDIAIQPEKTVEFIYIPVRLVNTDADMQSFYNTNLTNTR